MTRTSIIACLGALMILAQARWSSAQDTPSETPSAGAGPGDAGVESRPTEPPPPPASDDEGRRAPATTATTAPAAAAPTPAPAAVTPPPPAAAPTGPPAATREPVTPGPDTRSATEKKKKKKKKKRNPKVFGYLQVHYRHAIAAGPDQNVDNDDFRVQRARLGVKGDVNCWLGYDVEIDPRAPEITGVLRDAFLKLKVIPAHQIRIGQQKTQFGYENRESSSRLYAVNRTELSDNLSRGGVTLRDIGIGLIGKVKLGKGFRLEDAITVVNGDGMNVQADSTPKKDVWGRLGARYKNDRLGNLAVSLGGSGATGDFIDEGDDEVDPADDFRLEFRRLGADFEVDHDWFFVSTEYVLGQDKDTVTGETDDPSGYYVNVVGKTPWQVGPIVRYDTLGSDFKRWTFGVFYGLPKEPFRVLLNYEYRQLRDGVRADDKFYVWAQVRF